MTYNHLLINIFILKNQKKVVILQRVRRTRYNFKTMKEQKIIRVRLHIPHNGQSDFYFTSLKSIFLILDKELVGISYSALVNTHFTTSGFYANKCCVMTSEMLH